MAHIEERAFQNEEYGREFRPRTVADIIQYAEAKIAEYEAEHAGWREAFGERCAQPHEPNITELRELLSFIGGDRE